MNWLKYPDIKYFSNLQKKKNTVIIILTSSSGSISANDGVDGLLAFCKISIARRLLISWQKNECYKKFKLFL